MLDTNAVAAIVKGRAESLSATLNSRPFCISVVTEAELRFGLARRVVNAELRRIVETFLASVDIRPWTSIAALRYGTLRAALETLGKTARTHGLADRQPSSGRRLHAGQRRPRLYAGSRPHRGGLVGWRRSGRLSHRTLPNAPQSQSQVNDEDIARKEKTTV